MRCNAEGLKIIKDREGLELEAYPDPASALGKACQARHLAMREYRQVPGWEALCGKPWTIGYGDTGNVQPGQRITPIEAWARLAAKINGFEAAVSRAVHVPLNENQFSALVSFVYNVGPEEFLQHDMLRFLNAGDYARAAAEFPLWIHASGQVLPGLITRRALEQALFLRPA